MRIASGTTDQYVYFKAVDATDRVTPETGLSSFTVYRSRNGAAAAAMSTPTINETSSGNMPGVYELLLDEDMTIGAGNITEAMVFHITHAGMAPVTLEIELFVPPPTVAQFEARTVTSATYATASALATVDNNVDAILVDTGISIPGQISGLNDLSSAEVNAACDTALADYDGPTNAEMEARTLASADYATAAALTTVDGVVDAIKVTTDKLDDTLENDGGTYRFTQNALEEAPTGGSAPTAGEIADAVWEEAIADHSGTAGSTAEQLAAAGAAGDPWATALPGSYTSGQAGKIVGDNLNAAISSRMPTTHIDATGGKVDGVALVDTVTTNTDMRGTDSAATASALSTMQGNVTDILADTATSIPALIGGLNDISTAQVNAQVAAALATYDPPTKAELDSAVSPLATSSALTTVGNNVSAVKAKTDQMAFTKANEIDANIRSINSAGVTGDGSGTPWDAA